MVLKTGPTTEIAAEAWACRRLTALGFPVPAVLAVSTAEPSSAGPT